MAVTIGSDGTISCNTVKYNWYQARNMISDGTYGNITGNGKVWENVNPSTSPAGYKAYRSFYIESTVSYYTDALRQLMPDFVTGHTYYFSVYAKATENNKAIWIFFDADGTGLNSLGLYDETVGTEWKLFSALSEWSSETSGCYIDVLADAGVYLSKFILIDLTDTFGSGNEPTQAWCDANIREHEVYCNFGCTSDHVTPSNYTSRWALTYGSLYTYNYLELDSDWEPREYMYMITSSTSYVEALLKSASTFTLTNTNTYYFQIEVMNDANSSLTFDCYFPEAEPYLGRTVATQNTDFNGGGGMSGWKRVSMFNTRSSFDSGSYIVRFDFNNNYIESSLRATALQLTNVSAVVTQYNNYNGTSITIDDVNKEWCDRWIDGRSSPIIHIKDPNNTEIKFNTDYDIVCNDIEIRPELDHVEFDYETGTIRCKKLVRDQTY